MANIFVTPSGLAKILDFVLAKLIVPYQHTAETTATAEELLTSPGSAVGTIAYMSPEQARGEELDSGGKESYEDLDGNPALRRDAGIKRLF